MSLTEQKTLGYQTALSKMSPLCENSGSLTLKMVTFHLSTGKTNLLCHV